MISLTTLLLYYGINNFFWFLQLKLLETDWVTAYTSSRLGRHRTLGLTNYYLN